MFRSFSSRDRAGKKVKSSRAKRSFSEDQKKKLQQSLDNPPVKFTPIGPVASLVVGPERRLFAAHEDQLLRSPIFAACLRSQLHVSSTRQILLPDEEPEILSCILEFLYKGDYSPRLLYSRRRNSFSLETEIPRQTNLNAKRGVENATMRNTVYVSSTGSEILRDTVVYCAAERYGLGELQCLALRKQRLQAGIHVDVMLRSARYAYTNTPDTDSQLRSHYLALIIRCRKTFRRSLVMEKEMNKGGSQLFFDLFVSMCRHIDDVVEVNYKSSPRTV